MCAIVYYNAILNIATGKYLEYINIYMHFTLSFINQIYIWKAFVYKGVHPSVNLVDTCCYTDLKFFFKFCILLIFVHDLKLSLNGKHNSIAPL